MEDNGRSWNKITEDNGIRLRKIMEDNGHKGFAHATT